VSCRSYQPLIHLILQSSPLWLDFLVWICARKLEVTPPSGRYHAARFLVRVLLLLLLCWTDDVYTLDVCRTTAVPPVVVLVFIDLFDYTTLRSASLVFIDNICAGTFPIFSVFKGMNSIATLLPYNYVE
jgi:hypothetical protein